MYLLVTSIPLRDHSLTVLPLFSAEAVPLGFENPCFVVERAVDERTTLRYVAYCKKPRTRLKTFMTEAGGVNACADRYTKLKRRRNRRN